MAFMKYGDGKITTIIEGEDLPIVQKKAVQLKKSQKKVEKEVVAEKLIDKSIEKSQESDKACH